MARPKSEAKAREMSKLLKEQAASGLSMVEFCRQRRVPVSRLRWWKRRLGERAREEDGALDHWIELKSAPAGMVVGAAGTFVLEFPGGERLSIPRDANCDQVRSVLEGIRQCG